MKGNALVLAGLLTGCTLFGGGEEQAGELEGLPVVADHKPFDPAQAVDDDDDLERPWSGAAATEDQDAFEAKEPPPAEVQAREASTPRGAGADATGRGARSGPRARRAAAGPSPDVPTGEHVASLAEVEALRAHRRRQVESAGGSDDAEMKRQIASNPPPEPLGPPKPAAWTALDYALEGALLGTLALAVSLLVALAQRWPKTALAIAVAAAAMIAVVLATQGE